MDKHAYEAAAMIAAYAAEAHNGTLYTAAAELATGMRTDPVAAIDMALRTTETHPRMSFAAWVAQPHADQQISRRIALQESFEAYRELARRASSPLLCATTVIPLHRPHLGSQAIAFGTKDATGEPLLLKIPRKIQIGTPRRHPLGMDDRASFAEHRVRLLPDVPDTNFEQIKALSYAGPVVTTHIPGRPIYKLCEAELAQVTDEHILKAIRDLTVIALLGVEQDSNGANTHFTPERGFGFFDPLSINSTRWSLLSSIQGFARNLCEVDRDAPKKARTPGAYRLRRGMFDRLKALAPHVPSEAVHVIDELSLAQ